MARSRHQEAHRRIRPGTLDDHVDTIATYWIHCNDHGQSLAITTARNEHVDIINGRIQAARWQRGDLDPARGAATADGIGAYVGDLIATRRNDRTLITSTLQFVGNREQWIVTTIDASGGITAARVDGGGIAVLPATYAREHVRLGYAATEPGNQSDTQDRSITLATGSTTGRGLDVGMTRGRRTNHVLVATETPDVGEARDVLERAITYDRANVPAVSRRDQLVIGLLPSLVRTQLNEPCRAWAPSREIGIEID